MPRLAWNAACSVILLLAVQSTALAQSICDRLRTAEARGIVVDSASYSVAADAWSTDPASIPVFSYETIQIGQGETLWSAMSETAFLPDKYNLEVVASLNPGIADLSHLQVGQSVSLPNVPAGDSGAVDGFKFWPALAAEWSDTTVAVVALDEALALVNAYAGQDQVQAEWDAVVSFLGGTKESITSIDVVSFEQIEKVISAYQSAQIISKLLSDGTAVSDLDPDTVLTVVNAAAAALGRVDVVVRTVSQQNEKIDGLRVFALTDAENQFDCWKNKNEREFNTRSYEAKATLSPGTWVIRAMNENGQFSERLRWSVDSRNSERTYTVVWEN